MRFFSIQTGLALVTALAVGCGGRAPSSSNGTKSNAENASGGSVAVGVTGGTLGSVSGGAMSIVGGKPSSGGALASGGNAAAAGGSSGVGGASIGSGGTGTSGGANATGGGTSGGTASTGGTGTFPLAYDPCPPQGQPCVLLPYGDSITDGYSATDKGGYRSKLFHLALQNGKSISFTGTLDGGPELVDGQPFPAAHEGHSGQGIGDLLTISQTYLASLNPNIILLMIGTNDLGGGNLGGALGGLLDATFTAVPNALVVVAQITAQNGDNSSVTSYNNLIPAIVQARANAGKHVIMVDMYSAFTANPNYATQYLVDYAHPTDAGYAVMANVWYQAIGTALH